MKGNITFQVNNVFSAKFKLRDSLHVLYIWVKHACNPILPGSLQIQDTCNISYKSKGLFLNKIYISFIGYSACLVRKLYIQRVFTKGSKRQ